MGKVYPFVLSRLLSSASTHNENSDATREGFIGDRGSAFELVQQAVRIPSNGGSDDQKAAWLLEDTLELIVGQGQSKLAANSQ